MITIRHATLQDANSLRNLAVKTFVSAYEQYNTPADMAKYLSENFSEEKIISEISDPDVLLLLAVSEGELVGYTKLLFKTSLKVHAHKPLEIARLYTHTDLIGAGIGKRLVNEIFHYAMKHKFDLVCLGVWKNNPGAIRFYEREGFVIAGTTPFLFGNDLQEDFIMIKKA
ncbi:MAG TPA: N-acetyltransferase [Bacteroidia bacterium]|nr:N-acetyltransferase [Bacteroidia bacterium]